MASKVVTNYWTIGIGIVIATLILIAVMLASNVQAEDGGAGTSSTGCDGSGSGVCNPDGC